jgi:hypothetical protein
MCIEGGIQKKIVFGNQQEWHKTQAKPANTALLVPNAENYPLA